MATGPSPSPEMFTLILTAPFSSKKTIVPETLLPFFGSIVAIAFFVFDPEQATKIAMHVNSWCLFILLLSVSPCCGGLWLFSSFSKQRCANPNHG